MEELRELGRAADQDFFRRDLLNAVKARTPENPTQEQSDFAFVCEVAARLSDAEEFQDFIPCHFTGTGQRGRKLRVDGYEIDELDDSIRLLIADFRGGGEVETIVKSRAESVFAQLKGFVEESVSGREWRSENETPLQTQELSKLIEQKHCIREGGARSVSRYRMYLITDSSISERLKELPIQNYDGVPIEFHIWDIGRLEAVTLSLRGAEELEIDFTEFQEHGLPCLAAGENEDCNAYLCVVPGDVLSELYDRYGSKLLEGNVRSFLSTTNKINKGIQATIRKEPAQFFVYNNGISATATSAVVETNEGGTRLISAQYLQIVNGGQTTASLHIAKRRDRAELSDVYVQMKLTVVKTRDNEMLDSMIQKIARYSNSQTKVSDSDFFSNHPFHRALERRSRDIKAPAAKGAQFNTHWFYERARGQYLNEQSKMTVSQKKAFQQFNPRAQLIAKTDLAKCENSFKKLPHVVSCGAQDSFKAFAKYINDAFGADGAAFDNETYFREVVSHIILFRYVERMVSEAKDTWYGGGYRAQIVTYTLAKLEDMIATHAPGTVLNLKAIWARQGISSALAQQLEEIAKRVSAKITSPPVALMNIGEWCKKEECWGQVRELQISLQSALIGELISAAEAKEDRIEGRAQGRQDSALGGVMEVVRLRTTGCWAHLMEWSRKYSPIYGSEADLVRNANDAHWVPTDRQASRLLQVLRRLEQEGFSAP